MLTRVQRRREESVTNDMAVPLDQDFVVPAPANIYVTKQWQTGGF